MTEKKTIERLCPNCIFVTDAPIEPGADWQGFCTLNPPTPAMMVGQGPPTALSGGQPTQIMRVIAIQPPVTAKDHCGQFYGPKSKTIEDRNARINAIRKPSTIIPV